jgi:anti-sigma B factor antagonist
MTFSAQLQERPGMAILELTGDLDSTTAPVFRDKVEEAAELDPAQLIIDLSRLDYLSSAGLRVLVFARQKMADGVALVLVGAGEAVAETIRLTGFDQSVSFSETLPG